jgi:hypothetical protein
VGTVLINDEAQRQVLPILARSTVTATTDSQQRNSDLLQLNPGQQVKAEIIATLPNSLFLARIAGQMYKLEIPLNVQPGETMELTFVSAEPRLTFQFLRQEAPGSTVQLSSLGKWLATVSEEAPSLVAAQEPLLEDPAQATTLLAARLQEAVTHSGLFYESHLAQWAAGGMQLKEILKEPQGKLSSSAPGKEEAKAEARGEAGYADQATLPLIKEQLNLLNAGTLCWRGEAWPGQGMELTVTGRDAAPDQESVEAALSLTLQHLGGVKANIRFTPEGLHLGFVCDQPGSASVLKNGGERLRQGLASCGLHTAGMAVRDGEAAE